MPRDAHATRAAIRAAARAEFSAHGLAGARVDRIAAAAGCNKERIYAWFGDKASLYRTVLAEMLEELRLATIVELQEDVADYVRKSYDFHREHPELVRMLLWEALECSADEIADESARRDCYTLSASALTHQLDDGADQQARRLLLTLIGLTAWPTAMPALAAVVTADESRSEAGQERLKDFTADFAAAAVAQLRSGRVG